MRRRSCHVPWPRLCGGSRRRIIQHKYKNIYEAEQLQKLFRRTHCSLFFSLLLLVLVRLPHSKVLANMGSMNNQTDEKLAVNPAPRVTFCQRNKSENGSFVSKLRNHFHEFIHASMDEHKTCLRNTIRKIFDASMILGKNNDSTNEGENSLSLQAATRN